MVLSLLSGLPPRPRGVRRIRSAWRRRVLRVRRKRDLAEFAKSLKSERGSSLTNKLKSERGSSFTKKLKIEQGISLTEKLKSEQGISLTEKLKSERGSLESALVIIPLMTLFLISFQLVLSINSRNIEASYAQSAATHNSITGRLEKGDRIIDLKSPDAFNKLRAVVTTHNRNLPNLVPFLGSKDRATRVHGFSILENQN